jgi:hypothetical protein
MVAAPMTPADLASWDEVARAGVEGSGVDGSGILRMPAYHNRRSGLPGVRRSGTCQSGWQVPVRRRSGLTNAFN